jgi:hypothetical protein
LKEEANDRLAIIAWKEESSDGTSISCKQSEMKKCIISLFFLALKLVNAIGQRAQ